VFGIGGGICDTAEVSTAYAKDHGLCHYVGDYCENSWPLVGCVQMARMYCCWDGKLPRIIQEQGRQFLSRFNQVYCPSGDTASCMTQNRYWNTPTTPDCMGLLPEELSSLGPYMGKKPGIDLSEFINDITSQITASIPTMQQDMTTQIQNFYNLIQK
jgi:conjugal transfer mating pair stabilization protein TraN